MDSLNNSQFMLLSASFASPTTSGLSPKPISIDSLTNEFFEDLQGVINECESSLLSSEKEMEDLDSESNSLSVMEQHLYEQIRSLTQYNKELQVRLSQEKNKLRKITLHSKINGNSSKTANCEETQC